MSATDHPPPHEDVSGWLEVIHRRWLSLHLKAGGPSIVDRDTAFAEMAALAAEAIRKVRQLQATQPTAATGQPRRVGRARG